LTIVVALLFALCAPSHAKAPAKPKDTSNAPSDPTELSLRIAALEALYDLDLSVEQLQSLGKLATGTTDAHQRAGAKATAKLKDAMKGLYDAILKGDDPDKVAELREQVTELTDDDNVDIDDDIQPTDAAKAKVADALKKVKASQLAAYLAEHADEIADPVELMMDTLAEVHEAADADDPESEMQHVAAEVGWMVAGMDVAKAKEITDKVGNWLHAGKQLKEEEYAGRIANFEESAKRIVGDIGPMQVLNHWVEHELAHLLSNPQLPVAVEDMVEAKNAAANAGAALRVKQSEIYAAARADVDSGK
jgi:hypothetical protein